MDALVLLAAGLGAGVLAGLLGIGGGILMTPVLHYVLHRPWPEAVALSLFAIAVQAPLGVWQHAHRGAVDWRMAVPLAVAGLVGVAVGDVLMPHVSVRLLKLLFAALMLLAAWRLVAAAPEGRQGRPRGPLLWGVGGVAGLTSRLLGIGGGLVTVPALTMAGVRAHVAVGTSLVAVFTAAALATGANLARGLDAAAGLLLAAGALAGITAGVRLSHALPARRLARVFAAALVLAAAYIALTA